MRVSVGVGLRGAAFQAAGRTLRLSFPGSRPASALEGLERQAATTQYLIGNRPEAWRRNVAHYDRVAARGVYAGIDVIYYNNGRNLEYDFVVAPGADPASIRMRFGNARPAIQADGSLRFDSEFVQQAPVTYQERAGRRVAVESRYQLARNGDVRIVLGAYDRSLPLVIDPAISFAGYIGGELRDVVNATVAAPDGTFWVAGYAHTVYPYIPEATEPFQPVNGGGSDGFLARIMPTENGWRMTHYTFLGGSGTDEITAITYGSNRVVVAGTTDSQNFPVAGYVPQKSLTSTTIGEFTAFGGADAFVAYYDPTEVGINCLTFSTYFGGPGTERAQAVAIDAKGQAIIAGYTNSGTLQGLVSGRALQPSNRGGVDGFIARFDPSQQPASVVNYVSFLGGNSTDLITGLSVDPAGLIYVTGTTMSWDFPLAGASYQASPASFGDLFLTKLDIDKDGFDSLLYSTYFGGSDLDTAEASVIDAQGRVWITGYTASEDLPVSPGAAQLANAGGFDVFLVRLDPSKGGSSFVSYCTYLGGSGADVAYGLALDRTTGMVTVAGYTVSPDFPVKGMTDFTQPPIRQSEAFVARIDPSKPDAAGLVWSTMYGGAGADVATGVTLGADGNPFVAGMTTSAGLPVGANPNKSSAGGIFSGFFFALK